MIVVDYFCFVLKVIFRMVVFRPKVEEILVGRIKSCSREGVQISLGFYDEIFVGPESLQHPARFDETENVWVWEYPGEEEGQHHDLFMDPGEMVRQGLKHYLALNDSKKCFLQGSSPGLWICMKSFLYSS